MQKWCMLAVKNIGSTIAVGYGGCARNDDFTQVKLLIGRPDRLGETAANTGRFRPANSQDRRVRQPAEAATEQEFGNRRDWHCKEKRATTGRTDSGPQQSSSALFCFRACIRGCLRIRSSRKTCLQTNSTRNCAVIHRDHATRKRRCCSYAKTN